MRSKRDVFVGLRADLGDDLHRVAIGALRGYGAPFGSAEVELAKDGVWGWVVADLATRTSRDVQRYWWFQVEWLICPLVSMLADDTGLLERMRPRDAQRRHFHFALVWYRAWPEAFARMSSIDAFVVESGAIVGWSKARARREFHERAWR